MCRTLLQESQSPSSRLTPVPIVHTASDHSFPSGHAIISFPVTDAACVNDFHKPQGSFALPSDELFSKFTLSGASPMGRRFRKSFNDIRHPTNGQLLHWSLDGTQNMTFNSDATTAAATVHVAAISCRRLYRTLQNMSLLIRCVVCMLLFLDHIY